MRTLLTALTFAAVLMTASARSADLPADIDLDLNNMVVSESELICLALNDYWESRGEPLLGRVAVAQVVLNRARDRKYPTNLCDVVKQSPPGRLSGCQFSWHCDGRSDHPADEQAWRESVLLASAMVARDSAVVDPTHGAKWYHATRVRPFWSERLEVTRIISGHVFYRDPAVTLRERRFPVNFADWAAERSRKRYQQVAAY